jgi:hypothetical protein
MTNLKAWCESKWEGPMLNIGHGNVFTQEGASIRVRGGSARNYKSKEQKAYEARFGIYNDKLRSVILAEATKTDGVYRWPKTEKPAKTEQAPAIPRKRVPKAKLEQAAAIIAKVPQDELATFLARFGLSLSLAASIASLDNAEMIARQFLRVTL